MTAGATTKLQDVLNVVSKLREQPVQIVSLCLIILVLVQDVVILAVGAEVAACRNDRSDSNLELLSVLSIPLGSYAMREVAVNGSRNNHGRRFRD